MQINAQQLVEYVKTAGDVSAVIASWSALVGLLTNIFALIAAIGSAAWVWYRWYDWYKKRNS